MIWAAEVAAGLGGVHVARVVVGQRLIEAELLVGFAEGAGGL